MQPHKGGNERLMIRYMFVKTHSSRNQLFQLINHGDHVPFHVNLNKQDHLYSLIRLVQQVT